MESLRKPVDFAKLEGGRPRPPFIQKENGDGARRPPLMQTSRVPLPRWPDGSVRRALDEPAPLRRVENGQIEFAISNLPLESCGSRTPLRRSSLFPVQNGALARLLSRNYLRDFWCS
jgi:hypothetical protein